MNEVAASYTGAAENAAAIAAWLLATAEVIEELNTEAARVEAEIAHDNVLESLLGLHTSRLHALDQLAAEARQNLARTLRDNVQNNVAFTKQEPTHSWWYYLPSTFPDAVRTTAKEVKDGAVEGFLATPKIAAGLYQRSIVNYFVDRDQFNQKWQETERTADLIGKAYHKLGAKKLLVTVGKQIIKNPAKLGGNILGGLAFGEIIGAVGEAGTAARSAGRATTGATEDAARVAAGSAEGALAEATSLVTYTDELTGSTAEFWLDDLGRPLRAHADDLGLADGLRNSRASALVRAAGESGDDAGHLLGDRFGQLGEDFNLVPQDSNLNRGAWRSMENSWATAIKEGRTVNVSVEPTYTGNSLRPDSFQVDYSIDGVEYSNFFINKPGG